MSLGFPVRVYWDYDEEDRPTHLPEVVILPAELCHDESESYPEEILDWLTDEYGYYVYSLEFL